MNRSSSASDPINSEYVSYVVWDPDIYFTEKQAPKVPTVTSARKRGMFSGPRPSAYTNTKNTSSVKQQNRKKTPDSRRVLLVDDFNSESKYDEISEQKFVEIEPSKPEPKTQRPRHTGLTRPQAAQSHEREPPRPSQEIYVPTLSVTEKVNYYLKNLSSSDESSERQEDVSVFEESTTTTTTERPTPAKKPSNMTSARQRQQVINWGPTLPPLDPDDYFDPRDVVPRVDLQTTWKFYITQCETEDLKDAEFCTVEQLKRENGMLNVIVVSKPHFEYKSKTKDKTGQPTGPLIRYTESMEEFTKKFSRCCESRSARNDMIRINECFPHGYYCVKDGDWFRIQVMAGGGRDDTQVKAFFIDRGVVKYVKKADLRFIHKAFTSREAFDEDFRYKARAFHAQINLTGCNVEYVKGQIIEMAGSENRRWFEHSVTKAETHEMSFPLLTLGPPEDI